MIQQRCTIHTTKCIIACEALLKAGHVQDNYWMKKKDFSKVSGVHVLLTRYCSSMIEQFWSSPDNVIVSNIWFKQIIETCGKTFDPCLIPCKNIHFENTWMIVRSLKCEKLMIKMSAVSKIFNRHQNNRVPSSAPVIGRKKVSQVADYGQLSPTFRAQRTYIVATRHLLQLSGQFTSRARARARAPCNASIFAQLRNSLKLCWKVFQKLRAERDRARTSERES